MEHRKSVVNGLVSDYQKMYKAVKNWNEPSPPTTFVGSVPRNEPGHYLYGMGWALSDLPFHGYTGETLSDERYHFEEVRKAHRALKVALQNALGIEQMEKEI